MDNPNEYNDEMYSRESLDLDSAVQGMWEAGASLEEIADTVRNAFDNAEVKVHVVITEAR